MTEPTKPTWVRLKESERKKVAQLAAQEDRDMSTWIARLVRERLAQIEAKEQKENGTKFVMQG